jgi:hypothetical protein
MITADIPKKATPNKPVLVYTQPVRFKNRLANQPLSRNTIASTHINKQTLHILFMFVIPCVCSVIYVVRSICCITHKYDMNIFKWLGAIGIALVLQMQPASTNIHFVHLAACMAVIDFQITFYSTHNQLHADTPHHSAQKLSRLFSIREHLSTQVISRLEPDQMEALSQLYLLSRDQVFTAFTVSLSANQIQDFVQAIRLFDQECEPVNMGIEQ